MSTNERRRQEIQQREEEAWRLRVAGLTQWQIASRLEISQPAVSKILARTGQRLAAEFTEEVKAHKAAQTGILEAIVQEAMIAWQKSKADAETVATVSGRCSKEGGPLPDQVTHTVQGQTGNPAHLAQARGALADIRALWGLDAPLKAEHAGPGGGPIPLFTEVWVELPEAPPAAAADPEPADEPAGMLPPIDKEPAKSGGGGLEVVVELPR